MIPATTPRALTLGDVLDHLDTLPPSAVLAHGLAFPAKARLAADTVVFDTVPNIPVAAMRTECQRAVADGVSRGAAGTRYPQTRDSRVYLGDSENPQPPALTDDMLCAMTLAVDADAEPGTPWYADAIHTDLTTTHGTTGWLVVSLCADTGAAVVVPARTEETALAMCQFGHALREDGSFFGDSDTFSVVDLSDGARHVILWDNGSLSLHRVPDTA